MGAIRFFLRAAAGVMSRLFSRRGFRMRVVMIGPFAWSPKGTVSSRAALLGQALVGRGHSVVLLIPPYDNPAQAGFCLDWGGVDVRNMTLPTWGDSLWSRMVVPSMMAHRALRQRPDVIHIFKPSGYAGLSGILLRPGLTRVPLVLDSDDWEGRGGWADLKPYPTLLRYAFAWQERWLARRVDAVTVASRTLEAQMWGFGVEPEAVFYVPNGPSPIFRDASPPSPEEKSALRTKLGIGTDPMALYIGHISYESEVSLLVEALPKVAKHAPEIRVVIVGSGPGCDKLRNLAIQRQVSDHLLFAGWVAPQLASVYLAAADIALYPHRDSLVNRAKSPSKITAYMAMGKPVVASSVGETVAYLDDGRAGCLVEPGNADAFADGMIALLCDRERAKQLGQRAEQRIWEHYDWNSLAEAAEAAYQLATRSGEPEDVKRMSSHVVSE